MENGKTQPCFKYLHKSTILFQIGGIDVPTASPYIRKGVVKSTKPDKIYEITNNVQFNYIIFDMNREKNL